MIAALPANFRSEIEPVLERVVESTRRRRRILTLVQEALSQLRLDMKYLVFDLEATRRERDAYRQQRDEKVKRAKQAEREGEVASHGDVEYDEGRHPSLARRAVADRATS